MSNEFACQLVKITGPGQGHFWQIQGHSVTLWAILSWAVRFHLWLLHLLVQMHIYSSLSGLWRFILLDRPVPCSSIQDWQCCHCHNTQRHNQHQR